MIHKYAFNFTENDNNSRNVSYSVDIPDDSTYHDVVEYFGDFLSAVFGYRINLEASVDADTSNT